jgi:putative ABC transport system substrate-binding protein
MLRRPSFAAFIALGLLVGAASALAQDKRRDAPARVAILDDAPPATRAAFWEVFRRRMAELGYVEGKNVIYEQRWAHGSVDRLPTLAAELVALAPDAMVVVTTTVAIAAKKATSTIPIIALGPADPVKSGLVSSLARPGGNLTGTANNQAEIAGQWVELAREVAPGAKSLAYLTDVANPGEMLVFRNVEEQARALGIDPRPLDGITAASVAQSFATIERERVDVLVVATTASLVPHRQQIVDAAARLRLPAIYARQEYSDAGGLISYGTEPARIAARGAEYLQKILQGAKPADLPFEMASTYRLVVNARAAGALGVRIPQAVLTRADEVIR